MPPKGSALLWFESCTFNAQKLFLRTRSQSKGHPILSIVDLFSKNHRPFLIVHRAGYASEVRKADFVSDSLRYGFLKSQREFGI